jgi:hypothetical protein
LLRIIDLGAPKVALLIAKGAPKVV